MTLSCLIIEDEPVARDILRQYIQDVPHLTLIKEFDEGISASSYLKEHSVDLIFLDINMPKLSGISLLKSLTKPPKVILTTAYSEYALEGYELDVVDYLLKPFSFERFLKAVNKVEVKQETESSFPTDITIKADKKLYRISTDDILTVEGNGDYLTLKTVYQKLTFYRTMKSFSEELDPSKFLRVHKSFIVNLEKIDFVEGNMIQIGGTTIPIGQAYKDEFKQKFL